MLLLDDAYKDCLCLRPLSVTVLKIDVIFSVDTYSLTNDLHTSNLNNFTLFLEHCCMDVFFGGHRWNYCKNHIRYVWENNHFSLQTDSLVYDHLSLLTIYSRQEWLSYSQSSRFCYVSEEEEAPSLPTDEEMDMPTFFPETSISATDSAIDVPTPLSETSSSAVPDSEVVMSASSPQKSSSPNPTDSEVDIPTPLHKKLR